LSRHLQAFPSFSPLCENFMFFYQKF